MVLRNGFLGSPEKNNLVQKKLSTALCCLYISHFSSVSGFQNLVVVTFFIIFFFVGGGGGSARCKIFF